MTTPHRMYGGVSHIQAPLTSMEKSLLRELKCPVCMEYIRPPIMLCENGHNICNNCSPRVPHCPTCRGLLLNTRNITLEKLARLVKYPCTYRKYGCNELYTLDLLDDHQLRCEFTPQICPVHKLNLGFCQWTGIASAIKEHLMWAHVNQYLASHVCRITLDTKEYKIFYAFGYLFFGCCEIQDGILYAVVQHIDPLHGSDRYQYKVQLSNVERTESIAVTHLARSYLEDLDEIRVSGNCVKLYPDQINRFRDAKNELSFSMELIKSDKP